MTFLTSQAFLRSPTTSTKCWRPRPRQMQASSSSATVWVGSSRSRWPASSRQRVEGWQPVFISATPAPGHSGYRHLLQSSDEDLLKMVTEMTGTNAEFLGEQFGATILRTLRNYGAITDYECPPGTTVSAPIFAFTGTDDTLISSESVAAWSSFTSSEFAVTSVAGDHFYVTIDPSELVEHVERPRRGDRRGLGRDPAAQCGDSHRRESVLVGQPPSPLRSAVRSSGGPKQIVNLHMLVDQRGPVGERPHRNSNQA